MSFAASFLSHPDLLSVHQAGEPWGQESVIIRFAGNAYAFTGMNTAQAVVVQERFGAYCARIPSPPASSVEISVLRTANEDIPAVRDSSKATLFDTKYASDSITVAGFGFIGRIIWTPKLTATLWTTENETLIAHKAFENFFRIVVAYHLCAQGGILLHSAAAVDGHDAYVFVGQSGAGKSTIARLSTESGRIILSDDLNALRLMPAGVIIVEQLPFAGDFGHNTVPRGVYPVRALCRLQQGDHPICRRLPPALAIASLLACAPFVNRDPYRQSRLLDTLQKLARRVPIHALTFSLDTRFWEYLTSYTDNQLIHPIK